MASNRRLTNPLALAVLVHLREKPRHPYELSSTLRERGKEKSIKLNYGSLYTVIESLEKDGYIRALKKVREGKRPEKTVYDITPHGENTMLEWMREMVSVPEKEYPKFEAALSLIPILTPEDAATLLEARLRFLRKNLETIDEEKMAMGELKLPRLFSIESEYYEQMVKTEYKFVEALIRDIKADTGKLSTGWKNLRLSFLKSKKTKK